MVAPRRTSRPRFTLLLIVLTAITLITLDYRANGGGVTGSIRNAARTVLQPVGTAVDYVVTPVGNVVGGILDFGRVRHENAKLRDELAQARSQVVEAQDAKSQLQRMEDELNLSSTGDIPSVAARVTGGSPSALQLTIEIDKGEDDGITRGMPVVSGGALIGRVQRAIAHRSTIQLLSDPALSVGVRLARTGDLSVATGDGGDMVMSLVEPNTEIHTNDAVVTSGLQESEYPGGLPVGRVISSKKDRAGLTQSVRVRPLVNLRRLSFVRVLQWSPS
ncbi:MAG TPA: rod shape-determining protein MreC [Acidimicrobiales bacterium]|nr:rod shape-determining protein MreC [Acidimicrobiales bacterium]